eukprot:TRINITY_DN68161_c0_g1_i1.p1 TRINITY_DN68161_c0_g1~~TRINITY_DN68161_c0_g1_i1.p1  ORF type:complete len:189 (+),score=49.34 TRINITY_DN68161_c0_g1_i1:52-567(+)
MGEPSPKKAKTSGKPAYVLNLNRYLVKDMETLSLHDIAFKPVAALQGLAALGTEALNHRGVKTILDLANWKFYKFAKALVVLEGGEECGARDDAGEMNCNKMLDKKWETKSISEILDAPVSALSGLTEKDDELFAKVHVKSVRDLGKWKFANWAEAMCDVAYSAEALNHKS